MTETAAPDLGQPAAPATAEAAATPNTQPDGHEQTGAGPEGQADGEAKAQTPRGVQKRLDEMRRQIGDTQRMNERLIGLVERAITKGAPPELDQRPSGPPRREDFADVDSWLGAKADYAVAQKVEEANRKAEANRAQEAARAAEKAWNDRVAKAAEKYQDFEEVAFADGVPITDAMAEAMRDSDAGTDIAYFLGKNLAEARRIASLNSAAAQAREIGKLELRLAEKSTPMQAKEPSRAPAPIEPVGKGKGGDKTPEQMSMSEYAKWRATRAGRR